LDLWPFKPETALLRNRPNQKEWPLALFMGITVAPAFSPCGKLTSKKALKKLLPEV
jgi:hypothetical protein